MISLLEDELVGRKGWIEKEELIEMIAVAESTPGPIAINMATYIGYNRAGVLGSFFATLGVVTPSVIIIFVISLFFDEFLSFKYVQYAFEGIQVAVVFVICKAGLTLVKSFKPDWLSITLFVLTLLIEVLLSIFVITVPYLSIWLILAGGIIGILYYCVFKSYLAKGKGKEE